MNHERLTKHLIRDESEELRLYQCQTGHNTIGIGRNLDANGISEEESRLMLKNDIKAHEYELRAFSWFENLSDIRQEVLLNLHFNIGHVSFLGFRRMIWAIENGNYNDAGDEMMDSKWFRQVGVRAERLVKAFKNNKF